MAQVFIEIWTSKRKVTTEAWQSRVNQEKLITTQKSPDSVNNLSVNGNMLVENSKGGCGKFKGGQSF